MNRIHLAIYEILLGRSGASLMVLASRLAMDGVVERPFSEFDVAKYVKELFELGLITKYPTDDSIYRAVPMWQFCRNWQLQQSLQSIYQKVS